MSITIGDLISLITKQNEKKYPDTFCQN